MEAEVDSLSAQLAQEVAPESPTSSPRRKHIETSTAPLEPLRIGLVVQRYGEDVNGGAEYHCRLIAEHLSRTHRVEVLTSCARDYITWANERPAGLDSVNGVAVRRFKVKRPRDPERFGRLSQKVFLGRHEAGDELAWLEEQGPHAPALLRHLKRRERDYDYFLFFSYRYYHSYHGVRQLPRKSVIVPTAEKDEVIELGIFKELFRLPRAIVYNSIEERDMIRRATGNDEVFGDVVGVGSDVPETADAEGFRRRHGVDGPYIVYIGRVDPNKGCRTLFHFFRRYREETGSPLSLVLVGGKQMDIPDEPAVRYLGFLPEADKWGALLGSELLIMPSELESLSMVTLEAWSFGKPVLANGRCDVLRGQCRRANAGLYYDDYYQFAGALSMLETDPELRAALGDNGRRYYRRHYAWKVIEGKYNRIFQTLRAEDRDRPPEPRPGLLRRLLG